MTGTLTTGALIALTVSITTLALAGNAVDDVGLISP